MKLQARFLLLLIFILGSVAVIIAVQHRFDIDRTNHLLATEISQRKQYFDQINRLEGSLLQTFSEDYSFWDDMVNFAKNGDLAFAHQNLDVGLETFHTDIDWVYHPNGTILYQSAASDNISLKDPKLPAAFFDKLKTDKFEHFYQQTAEGVLEVRAATIVGSNDPAHKQPAQGFWVIGRFLDKAHIKDLSDLSQSTVSLEPPSADKSDQISKDSISFSSLLADWQGQPVGRLRSTSSVPEVTDLNKSYSRQIRLLASLAVALMGLVVLFIWRYVLQPLRIINSAIKNQQPAYLARLAVYKNEFGNLAQTVKEFFSQKVQIAEAEFKRTELEKLNKEKTTFLAVAAHELKGPVSNISIFSDYLKFLLKRNAQLGDINQQLSRLSRQSVKINMLINDLREASLGSQSLKFNIRSFNFDEFLKEEVQEAAFTVKHKLTLDGSTQQSISSDPDRLGQVVSNLIRNAAKYSPKADLIKVASQLENGQIIVSVQDFGLGISAQDQPHIFERFYRSNSVSSAFPGLGLGLSISKQIIEKLGGKMWVKSTLSKGSTFYFSLPVNTT